MREILGEIADSSRGAVASSLIKRFRSLPPRRITALPRAIYMGIDPGAFTQMLHTALTRNTQEVAAPARWALRRASTLTASLS